MDTFPTSRAAQLDDGAAGQGSKARCPVDHEALLGRGAGRDDRCPADDGVAAAAPEETFTPFACPMGFGAPADDGTSARPRKRGYFIPGLIALVAMAGIGAAANFGGLDHGSPSRLAGSDVSTFLAQGIQAQQGLSVPPSITCPASEPVQAGLSFTCQWAHAGADQAVHVTETTAGQFRFSLAGG